MGHTGKHTRFQLDDLLAGRFEPSAQEIIRHIHEVNPTGRELPRRESERRYGIKNKLQSLLVRRFQDALVVVRDVEEDDARIVLLHHKFLGVAAGHAVVSELDDEARSWVRRQLDLGLAEPPSEIVPPARQKGRHVASSRKHSASWEEAMDEGTRALEAYDYDVARACFEHAHDLAPLAARPVCALLDLLVYQLALDAQALALADGLDEHLLAQPEVLAPLALAAARVGNRGLAERWVADLEGEPAAEVHRTLAGAALATGDLSAARTSLRLARGAFASHPELLMLEKRLGEAQARAAKPHETVLQELTDRDDWAAAEALAHQILEIFPGSTSARRVLKDVAARTLQAERASALTDLQAAIDRGDTKHARRVLAMLADMDADPATLTPLRNAVQAIEEACAHATERKEIDEVVQALARVEAPTDLETALVRYSALAPELRSEVRQRADRLELLWLDEMALHEEESRLPKRVPAIVAMGAAERRLAAGDLQGARAMLAPHLSLLSRFRRGRDVTARLAASEAEVRRRQAEELLAGAKAAVEAGDYARATSTIEKIRRHDLSDDRAREIETIKRRVDGARSYRDGVRAVEECLAAGDYISARKLLRILMGAQELTEQEASLRQSQLAHAEASLRALCTVLDEQPVGLHAGNAPEMAQAALAPASSEIGLLPGGALAVFASVQEGLLFVRIVDVATSAVRRLLVLLLPNLRDFVSCGLADNRLWLVDSYGRYVEISCDDWLPRLDRRYKAHVPENELLEGALAIPQKGALWLVTSDRKNRNECRTRIIDLQSGRLLRVADTETDFHRVVGTDPPLVARLNHQGSVRLADARGVAVTDLYFPQEGLALAIAPAPSGKGYFTATRLAASSERKVVVFSTDARGAMVSTARLLANCDLPMAIASIPPKQVSCTCYHEATTDEARIAYLHESDGRSLRALPDVPTHGTCELVQDEAGTTCVAVRRTRGGVVLTRLDDAPTEFPEVAVAPLKVPRVAWPLLCRLTRDVSMNEKLCQELLFEHADAVKQNDTARWAAEWAAKAAVSCEMGLGLYRFLRVEKLDEQAGALLAALRERFPANDWVSVALVESEASQGRWTGATLLETTSDDLVRWHLLHIQAVLCLHEYRFADAIQILANVPKREDCHLVEIREMAQALLDGLSDDAKPDLSAPAGLRELVRTILQADHHLDKGDLDSARRLLDQAWIRQVGEVQSLARLAELYLAAPPDRSALFRMATVIADFVDADLVHTCATGLWLGKNTWDQARLDEIRARALAWLTKIRTVKPAPASQMADREDR